MLKVSIIVPVYNSEEFLRRCLDSLVNQTLKEIEIIVVNDASPDNSIDIMREYEKKYLGKVIVIDSKVNSKAGGARNLGIDIAKGEYIGFVDSDDWVELNMYEELYNKAKESNTDIVDSNYVLSNGIGEDYKEIEINNKDSIGKLDIEKKKSLLVHTGSVWTKIYKKDMINKYNIRFPANLLYEDNEFIPAALLHAESFDKIRKPLYHYFKKNETSITKTKNSPHSFDRLITIINVIDYAKKLKVYETYKEELDFMLIKIYYINTIWVILKNFDEIPIDKLYEMKSYMKENYPNYKKNKYYKEIITKKSKKMARINDISPKLLVLAYKLVGRK